MLKGKEFGQAIAAAIALKLEAGLVSSKAEIARHFGIKPPSIADWEKKGAVSKDKLPELWRYFSDVVSHDHWGLTEDEWPAGLSPSSDLQTTPSDAQSPASPNQRVAPPPGDESPLLVRYQKADAATRTLIDIALTHPDDPLPEGLSPSLRTLVAMARTAIANDIENNGHP